MQSNSIFYANDAKPKRGRFPALAGAEPLTMSSKEIADLLDVRHDNVKVTIERLVNRGVIDLPAMQEHQTETSHGRKHNLNVYLLEKRDSYVVVAQLSP